MIRTLRQKQCLSQEELADLTGLSLRTIQRAESGQRVSPSSIRSLAEFFEVDVVTLKQGDSNMSNENEKSQNFSFVPQNLTYHRSAQLIIFSIAFFVCVIQWLAYYASLNEVSDDASLGRILSIVAMIALGASIFIYVFNMAKVTYYVSYYATASAFLLFGIALGFWTQEYSDSASYMLYFPVFYTLMLLALSIIHILQLAMSLKGETTILITK